jgi:hypothetical protein
MRDGNRLGPGHLHRRTTAPLTSLTETKIFQGELQCQSAGSVLAVYSFLQEEDILDGVHTIADFN